MSDRHAARGNGCGYRGFDFGSRTYPDSLCMGGFLADMDNHEPAPSDLPCPSCNTRAWLSDALDRAVNAIDTNPVATWEWAVVFAMRTNPAEAAVGVGHLGRLEIPDWDAHDPDKEETRAWPWWVPGLTAHQNMAIRSAIAPNAVPR